MMLGLSLCSHMQGTPKNEVNEREKTHSLYFLICYIKIIIIHCVEIQQAFVFTSVTFPIKYIHF